MLVAIAIAGAVAGCQPRARVHAQTPEAPHAATFGGPWASKLDEGSPLAGRIYDVNAKRFVGEDELYARAAAAQVVLLGEKHDNPDHHRLQARVLQSLTERQKAPAVAFEMLDADEQGAVTAAMLEHPKDADAIAQAVRWDHKGWPPWPEYAPIFRVAIAHDLPIVAANLPLAEVRALAHGGVDALPDGDAKRLGLDAALPDETERAIEEEMQSVHCGHLPAAALPRMALAQRARDAEMAAAIEVARKSAGSAVLIAGDGHVRKDRGVPIALAPSGDATLSIAFVEVQHGMDDPNAYAARWHTTRLPFDYVWFTPRVSDADPCAAFGAPPRSTR